ncbi:hypothetical protein IE81DRAFT_349071 [Ceraceosorus guamensis]|uniref:Uncharacterized protein n=1 Tax=Ceraceosorus guamensis TaxID=1522189 RepID=A0A316VWA1_9BASI|nr:hypothetical protein IE81DRAFT_349071 [Ceraceosorus guamensis]PWN40591.1 hypothetical protein IE81DRAFT_349071 [Ceraceosorus guamensis]
MKSLTLPILLLFCFTDAILAQEGPIGSARSRIPHYNLIKRPKGWTDDQVSTAWTNACHAIQSEAQPAAIRPLRTESRASTDKAGSVLAALLKQNPGEWVIKKI